MSGVERKVVNWDGGCEVVVRESDYARLLKALGEIRRIGTEPSARDNGPNYVANRMYHIADKALEAK